MSLKDLMIDSLNEQFEFAIEEDNESLHQALVDLDVIDDCDHITLDFIKQQLNEMTDEAFLNAYNFFVEFQG